MIADEPTTALDVTIQAQIIELVKRLKADMGMAMIWITHDLGVVAGIADRVIVMYAGYIVEEALVDDLYEKPLHPYTLALLQALPRADRRRDKNLKTIQGVPPNLLVEPVGCPFAPRCEFVHERCIQRKSPACYYGKYPQSCLLGGPEDGSLAMTEPLVHVENLTKHFPIKHGIVIEQQVGAVRAVDGISFDIQKGETLGLVGESGCGKTTAGRTLLGIVSGHIW